MRFETPKDAYRIIRVLKKELSVCSYLAEDSGRGKKADGGQRFLLLEFRNPVLAKEMMLYFMELKEARQNAPEKNRNEGKNPFPDFVDCFVKEKTVWAVFCYHEGKPFGEAAGRAASRRERMALWQGLLERLFFQRLPLYLCYEAAAFDNIVVDEMSAVWVNFELYETDRMHDDLLCDLQKRLYGNMRVFFAADKQLQTCFARVERADGKTARNAGKSAEGSFEFKMAGYARKLAEGSFGSGAELCREFQRITAQLSEAEIEGERGEGVLPWLWKFFFGHTDLILKCCYWFLVLMLWGIFFWLCFRPETVPEERNRITVIGTVEAGVPELTEE